MRRSSISSIEESRRRSSIKKLSQQSIIENVKASIESTNRRSSSVTFLQEFQQQYERKELKSINETNKFEKETDKTKIMGNTANNLIGSGSLLMKIHDDYSKSQRLSLTSNNFKMRHVCIITIY